MDEIKLYFYDEDKFYDIRMSDKVTLTVESKKPGRQDVAILDNGRKIIVPTHVKEGEEVVIKVEDETYVTKVSNL